MLKRRKWKDWVILENKKTGQKTFGLPTSKTEPFAGWSWSETTGEKQNPAAVPPHEPRELHLGDMSKSAHT